MEMILEMGEGTPHIAEANYDPLIFLGTANTLELTLGNLIYNEFTMAISVKFYHSHLGNVVLERTDEGTYEGEVYVPADPVYYPSVEGNISIYDCMLPIASFPIAFNTTFTYFSVHAIEDSETEEISIKTNVSRETGQGREPVYDSTLRVEIYEYNVSTEDTQFLTAQQCNSEDLFETTAFSTIYDGNLGESYLFKIFLEDGYYNCTRFLFNSTVQCEGNTAPDTPEDIPDTTPEKQTEKSPQNESEATEPMPLSPLVIPLVVVPGIFLAISFQSSKKVKKQLTSRK
jgi:hypothetical protein